MLEGQAPILYGSSEMDSRQKVFFRSTIQSLDPRTQDAFAACIFEPHHTIRFYASGELLSTMEICFQCSQVQWDMEAQTVPPWALYPGLAKVVGNAGFKAERDWGSVLRERGKAGAAPKSGT